MKIRNNASNSIFNDSNIFNFWKKQIPVSKQIPISKHENLKIKLRIQKVDHGRISPTGDKKTNVDSDASIPLQTIHLLGPDDYIVVKTNPENKIEYFRALEVLKEEWWWWWWWQLFRSLLST